MGIKSRSGWNIPICLEECKCRGCQESRRRKRKIKAKVESKAKGKGS